MVIMRLKCIGICKEDLNFAWHMIKSIYVYNKREVHRLCLFFLPLLLSWILELVLLAGITAISHRCATRIFKTDI